jgi:Ca-activated chloride channel family protein
VYFSQGLAGYFLRIALVGLLSATALPTRAHAAPSPPVEIELVFTYGSEKDKWLKQVTAAFERANPQTADGRRIRVKLMPMGSGQCVDTLLSGKIQAHLTSPASEVWITLANAHARQPGGAGEALIGPTRRLVRSPIVIAMWKSMVEAAGWTERAVGWNDLADLIEELDKSGKGWAAKEKGKKEWGPFKFAHTHPQLSNSGLLGVIAMVYAQSDSSRPLKVEDLSNPDVRQLISQIQGSVLFYGESTGFLGNTMLARGPNNISATVLYESEVLRINQDKKCPEPLMAVYPREGTFWSDHPVGVVQRPWVTPAHKEAAEKYISFLLDKPQQDLAQETGFRPGPGDQNTDKSLGGIFTAANGVDLSQPRRSLQTPSREVVEAILQLWQKEKKGCRVVLAIDVSFSMASYRKLERAREGAIELVRGLGENDSLTLLVFNNQVSVQCLDIRLDAKGKAQAVEAIGRLRPRGGTALYDAVLESCKLFDQVAERPDGVGRKSAIQAVILLSDGKDNDSMAPRTLLEDRLKEGRDRPLIFSIAYARSDKLVDPEDPDPPDRELLEKISKLTGGKCYAANPTSIDKVLEDINGFFGSRPLAARR